ncbi:hypothetical protein QZH41_018437 [Actinostola sp. cb2023]|nr:hypothetical protein QZH41_018437 [Actinostola sp. cb2023]
MAHINLIPGEQGVRMSTLSPKYLHTNSTSHTWPFSAVAELVDNAYDPDVEASQLWIDIERYGFEQCLTFTDNGAGMDSLKLHKMLSFGFCEKVAKKDHLPVGHYGNGFKSGSMRLGKDAIIFTKQEDSRSVGFLSQTYLNAVKAQTILVPIVSWDEHKNILLYPRSLVSVVEVISRILENGFNNISKLLCCLLNSYINMVQRADGDKALQDIIKYSLFKTKEDLLQQFSKICSITGTRIIVSHMRRTQEGKYEFDFRTDYTDIRIPDDVELESNKYKRQERQNHIPESDYSLKAYCSILYLRPRMQIILRGKKVRTTVIAKSLSKTEVDAYKPHGVANNLGVGVIGVIQCDYLQPTHNKQDFDYTKAYRSSMSALGSKLNDYWNEKKGRAQVNSNVVIPEPREVDLVLANILTHALLYSPRSVPDQLWVQCDNPECLKWRKLPPNVGTDNLPEKWYCVDHPEGKWRSCDVPEELEDETEESVQPYVKKQKKRL